MCVVDPAILKCIDTASSATTFRISRSGFSRVGFLALNGTDRYFLKISKQRAMIEGEAESYRHIYKSVKDFCPLVYGSGRCSETEEYFILTNILDFSSQLSTTLAKSLAALHCTTSPNGFYGFSCETCCADTVQDNTWNKSWPDFFSKQRLQPISRLATNASDVELQNLTEKVCSKVIPRLLGVLDIIPSLIHGDLWSGNEQNGKVFDSCALYAHSEFEISIMTMFGGFRKVINEYQQLKPIDQPTQEFDDRQRLYMCYHQLNHSGTGQGSSYKDSAKATLRDLIKQYC